MNKGSSSNANIQKSQFHNVNDCIVWAEIESSDTRDEHLQKTDALTRWLRNEINSSGGFCSFQFVLMVFRRLLRGRLFHTESQTAELWEGDVWTDPASHHWNRGNEFIVSADLDADWALIWARRSSLHFPWKSGLKLLEGKNVWVEKWMKTSESVMDGGQS